MNQSKLKVLNSLNSAKILDGPHDQVHNKCVALDDLKSRWLGNLQFFGHISVREQLLIEQSKSSIPAIYFLSKVHKALNPTSDTFPGRPIVATFDCHLHWLDKYITIINCWRVFLKTEPFCSLCRPGRPEPTN